MRSLTILAVLNFVMIGGVAAQTLTSGTWTGLMSPPGLDAVEITYDVHTTDSLAIDIDTRGPGGIISANDVTLEGDVLQFSMGGLGVTLTCTLLRQADRGFSGECRNPTAPANTPRGRLTMVPPTSP